MNDIMVRLLGVAIFITIWLFLFCGFAAILLRWIRTVQAELVQYCVVAEPVVQSAAGADFPWIKMAEYDHEQQMLEERGFRFVGDIEFVNLRHVTASPRAFSRVMLSRDGTVRIMWFHTYHRLLYSVVSRVFGKMRGHIAVEVHVEGRDGNFFSVVSTYEPFCLGMPPQITLEGLPPGLGILRTLEEFESRYASFRDVNPGFQPVAVASIQEVIDSELRQMRISNAYREKVGFLTVDEALAAGIKTRELAIKTVQDLQKELWRRGVLK